MKEDIKIISTILAIILVVFGIVVWISRPPQDSINLDPVVLSQTLLKEDSFVSGPKDAKVTLVEFADMECTGCAGFHPLIKLIRLKYKDNLRYVFRHYPLPQHSQAIPGAKAVISAQRQSKFEEMQDLVFQNQNEWSKQRDPYVSFQKYATDLKLDLKKFESDYNSSELQSKINQDVADGNTLQVDSTPSFFINGKKYTGDYSLAGFEKIIEPMLK